MKLLTLILSLFLISVVVFLMMTSEVEGLCGNYSLTYYKVKDLFKNPNVSDMKTAFNTHFTRDLITNCS